MAVAAIGAAIVKIGAAVVAAYKASAMVRFAIHVAAMIAVSAVSTALAARAGKINQGQELSLKLDPNMPRQIAIGRTATGGSLVWAFTYGNLGTKVPNRYLVRIVALSDRPLNGLVKILEGNTQLAFTGDVTTGERECTSHRKPDNQPAMWCRVYLGSDTPTAASDLVANSGGKWTSAHKGVGIAYAVLRYDYDPDAFANGEPNLTFVVDGAKVYDDRQDVSLGGTQQLNVPSTWAFSQNASVLTAQLLRGFRTNGSLLIGAQAREQDLPVDHLIAAHNTCDQDVPLAAGGTEKRYRAGMMLTASETTQRMLQDLKNAMDGDIFDRGGKIVILPGAVRTPVFALTDDDIDWTAERSYQPTAALGSLYNQVVGSYVPSVLNYIEDAYPVKSDPDYIEQDGGETISLTQDYRAVNSDTQIQRITMRVLKASRFQKVVAFTGPLWLYECQQGDWFTLTSERWGLTSKYFKAQLVTLSEDLRVTIIATETSPVIDGWSTADEVERTTEDFTPEEYMLADPTITPYAVEVTATVAGITTTYPAVDIAVTVPAGAPWSLVELQMRPSGNDAQKWSLPPATATNPAQRVTTNLLPGTAYQIRGRTSDGENYGDWTEWSAVSITTTGNIEVNPGVGTTRPGINLLDDPLFRMNAHGWVLGNGASRSIVFDGGRACQITVPAASLEAFSLLSHLIPVTSGEVYSAQVETDIISMGGRTTWYVQIAWYNSGGGYVDASLAGVFVDSWGRITIQNQVVPSGVTHARVGFFAVGSGTSDSIVRIRKPKLERGPICTVFTDDTTNTAVYDTGVLIDTLRPQEYGSNVTETRISYGIYNQGTGATANELAQLNPGEGAHLSGIAQKADRVNILSPSTGVTLTGNTITNTTGSNAFIGAIATRQRGPCFIEVDITPLAWSVLELDLNGSANYSATAYVEYNTSGPWNFRVGGNAIAGGTTTADLVGKLRLEYDGWGFRVLIAGREYAYAVAPSRNLPFLYPTAYAYNPGIPYTGINAGALAPRDSTLNLIPFDATSIIMGNSVTKSLLAGAAGFTTGGAYSQEVFTGSASLSFRSAHATGDLASRFMAGLTDNVGDKDYPNLDYAFYMDRHQGTAYIFESGNLVFTGPDFTPNTLLQITYDGDKVRYWVDGTVIRTTQTTYGRSFRFMTCQYDVGSTIKDIQWRPNHQVSVLGQNTIRYDTGGVVPQAELRTPEGISAGYQNQTAWGTYSTYLPTDTIPRVVAGLRTDGRIAQTIPSDVRILSDIVAYDELTSFDGSDTVGYDPLTPTSPVETVGAVLRRYAIHPEQEGAVGDGIADDTVAIQKCIDSGRDVHLTAGKVYKTTSGLVIDTHYQRIFGQGEIKAVGSFDIITVTGGCRGVELDVVVHSPDHVGGWAIKIANAERVQIRAYLVNVWGALYVEQNNVCSVEWLYASCRGPGIKWYGDATKRSDLLILHECIIGIYNTTSQVWGLDWDGNCHSLEVKFLAIVNAYGPAGLGGAGKGSGMIVRNTSGGPPPLIARIGHLEFDYVYADGIHFVAPAHDIDLQMPYIHSPLGGSCIRVDAQDRSGDLRISGGYMGSFANYAVENNTVHQVLMDGTTAIYNDAGGDGLTLGPVRNQVPRTAWDDNFFAHVSVTNPLLNFDTNDYILYVRSSNYWEFMIGGAQRVAIDGDGIKAGKLRVDDDAYLTLSSGNPILNFAPGDTLGYNRTGNEFFFNVGGSKILGISDSGTAVSLNMDSDAALRYNRTDKQLEVVINGSQGAYFDRYGTLRLSGDVRAKYLTADGWFFMYSNNGANNPGIWMDENDRFVYNRAGNYLEFQIANISKFTVDGDGVKSPGYRVDDELRFYLDSGIGRIRWDATDTLKYDRASNILSMEIASTTIWSSNASKFEFMVPLLYKVYTVAALPAGAEGMRGFVSDATSETFRAAATGGGTFKVPVHHDGTGWKIG